jgi:cytochrome c biogenesis protein CcmG, thiol:disulfide interchange protein DsbE
VKALLLLALVACGAPQQPPAQQLPHDAKLIDRDTAETFLAIERYRGRVVVLDFWAGWCAECKRTIPQVQRLAAAFASEGLIVVGVNAGEKRDDAALYAKELGIDYPIALDPDLVLSDRLGAGNLPLLVVVDRDGTIVHRAKTVDAQTLDVVRKLLHARSAR